MSFHTDPQSASRKTVWRSVNEDGTVRMTIEKRADGRHDRVPARKSGLTAVRSRLNGTDVATWLRGYQPQSVDRALWETRLRDFVVPAIASLDPSSIAMANQDALELARLAIWCLGNGTTLDLEHVLDPDTVERYVEVGLAHDPSRGDRRSRLRRLGRMLTTKAPWEPKPIAAKRRTQSAPYDRWQVDQLLTIASQQPTAHRQRAFNGILALGLAFGLDGRWVPFVRPADIEETEAALLAHVEEPWARAVPPLREFEPLVRSTVEAAPDGAYLIGTKAANKNTLSRLTDSFEYPPGVQPVNASRLRSTWIVAHLELGTRLPDLLAAAGVASLTTFSDLMSCVRPLPEGDSRRALRG